jgi:hypothetical protein
VKRSQESGVRRKALPIRSAVVYCFYPDGWRAGWWGRAPAVKAAAGPAPYTGIYRGKQYSGGGCAVLECGDWSPLAVIGLPPFVLQALGSAAGARFVEFQAASCLVVPVCRSPERRPVAALHTGPLCHRPGYSPRHFVLTNVLTSPFGPCTQPLSTGVQIRVRSMASRRTPKPLYLLSMARIVR